jgi:hypothetical protein
VNWFAEVCDHVDMWSYVEGCIVGGRDMLFVACNVYNILH